MPPSWMKFISAEFYLKLIVEELSSFEILTISDLLVGWFGGWGYGPCSHSFPNTCWTRTCGLVFDSYSHVSINFSNDIFEPVWQFKCFEMSQNHITVCKLHFAIHNYKFRWQNFANIPVIFHRKFNGFTVCFCFEPIFWFYLIFSLFFFFLKA